MKEQRPRSCRLWFKISLAVKIDFHNTWWRKVEKKKRRLLEEGNEDDFSPALKRLFSMGNTTRTTLLLPTLSDVTSRGERWLITWLQDTKGRHKIFIPRAESATYSNWRRFRLARKCRQNFYLIISSRRVVRLFGRGGIKIVSSRLLMGLKFNIGCVQMERDY